jgi:hypothetical protein
MATKKRAGRPSLSAAQKRERAKRVKIQFELNPYQLAILESWMTEQELIEGRSFSRAQAATHLIMSRLVKGKSKDEIDAIVESHLPKKPLYGKGSK